MRYCPQIGSFMLVYASSLGILFFVFVVEYNICHAESIDLLHIPFEADSMTRVFEYFFCDGINLHFSGTTQCFVSHGMA